MIAGAGVIARKMWRGCYTTTVIDGDTYDWVAERAACSLAVIFATLKQEVKEDVKKRTDLRSPEANYGFTFSDHGDGFFVGLDATPPHATSIHFSIMFRRGLKTIEISGDGIKAFEAIPTVNDEGKCRLKINGVEREFWQVRRMALEKLFFETV
jgi:hypothetical protein